MALLVWCALALFLLLCEDSRLLTLTQAADFTPPVEPISGISGSLTKTLTVSAQASRTHCRPQALPAKK
ncbi:MAG: hypothetical protein MPL62_05315 [Alphaproteobacteria bacterium]|nr:hypothetical protein [Alphaproteobacteria bacterium]